MERNGTGLSREATIRDSGAPRSLLWVCTKREGEIEVSAPLPNLFAFLGRKRVGRICPKKIFVDEWAFGESFENS